MRLLVDTGAERTILTEAAVAQLGLPHDPQHITRSFGIGGTSANWDAFIPGLTRAHPLPGLPRRGRRFSMDHTGGPRADGLLGADILLAFDMESTRRTIA